MDALRKAEQVFEGKPKVAVVPGCAAISLPSMRLV